jgi:hypothetical protein
MASLSHLSYFLPGPTDSHGITSLLSSFPYFLMPLKSSCWEHERTNAILWLVIWYIHNNNNHEPSSSGLVPESTIKREEDEAAERNGIPAAFFPIPASINETPATGTWIT